MNGLRALRYLGGKDATGRGSGPWIASMLPADWHSTYVEPFFGMGGVFRQRAPVRREVLNDVNSRVINWWRVVRDRGPELEHWLKWSPARVGRDEFQWAKERLDDPEPTVAAYALTVVLTRSYTSFITNPTFATVIRAGPLPTEHDVRALAARLKHAELECMDGVDLIETYCGDDPQAVIYCDPPYPTTTTSRKYKAPLDYQRLSAVLTGLPGRVLISGYGSEWDHLGWDRHEKKVWSSVGANAAELDTHRVEVAWANFPVANMQTSLWS